METVLHRADTRGHANHGWLNSHHSFSFANYYNPERMNFGMLRVLNDDVVAGGMGFGTHPHQNMEIISIPLEGDLQHMDNMGNSTVIKQGDVQIMSAGTGVSHSEYNKNLAEDVKFLQIWIIPREQNVAPRYDQISVADISKKNQLNQIVSPHPGQPGVWIYQDAWFFMGDFDAQTAFRYDLKKQGNGIYLFVLEGNAMVDGTALSRRDALGAWNTETVDISASPESKILVIEVPMV
jgi:quercetin 2,3-dioxygenase